MGHDELRPAGCRRLTLGQMTLAIGLGLIVVAVLLLAQALL